MVNLADILKNFLTRETIKSLATKIGATDSQTEWAVETVNALVIAFLAQKATMLQSATVLSKVFDRNKDGSIADDIERFTENLKKGKIDTAEGREIVEELFTDHRQEVLQLICATTGLTTGGATTVLVGITPLAVKAIAAEQQKRGWTVKELGQKLHKTAKTANDIVSNKVLEWFDKDKDGKIGDDFLETAKSFFKKVF